MILLCLAEVLGKGYLLSDLSSEIGTDQGHMKMYATNWRDPWLKGKHKDHLDRKECKWMWIWPSLILTFMSNTEWPKHWSGALKGLRLCYHILIIVVTHSKLLIWILRRVLFIESTRNLIIIWDLNYWIKIQLGLSVKELCSLHLMSGARLCWRMITGWVLRSCKGWEDRDCCLRKTYIRIVAQSMTKLLGTIWLLRNIQPLAIWFLIKRIEFHHWMIFHWGG